MSLAWGYVESLINWFGIAAAAAFLGAYWYSQYGFQFNDPCAGWADPTTKVQCYQMYMGQPM